MRPWSKAAVPFAIKILDLKRIPPLFSIYTRDLPIKRRPLASYGGAAAFDNLAAMPDMDQWFKEHQISEVEALLPDVAGSARGKFVPVVRYSEEEGIRLPEAMFIQTVTGEYAHVPKDVVSPADIDMRVLPDPATLRLVPWAPEPTAQIIHDCFKGDGTPIEIAPRYVLRRVLNLYDAEGWEPVVAPEIEFYLVQRNIDPDYPLAPPVGRSGRPEPARKAFSIDAVNEFEPTRTRSIRKPMRASSRSARPRSFSIWGRSADRRLTPAGESRSAARSSNERTSSWWSRRPWNAA